MKTFKMFSVTMETKLWEDKLSEEDIKLLEDVQVMSDNLISQVYIFIDLFHQYIDLVQSAAIFSPDFKQPDEDDAKVYPTQTSAGPHLREDSPRHPEDISPNTNREQRRENEKINKKKKLPFDVAGKNLGEPKQHDM
jgi:hypothetical protein